MGLRDALNLAMAAAATGLMVGWGDNDRVGPVGVSASIHKWSMVFGAHRGFRRRLFPYTPERSRHAEGTDRSPERRCAAELRPPGPPWPATPGG